MVADRNQKLYHDILTHPYNVQGTPTSFVPNLLVFLLTLFNLFMSGVISWDLVLVSDLQAASGQQPTIMVVVYLSTQGPNHLKFLPLGVGRFTWVKNPRSRHRTTVHVQILHRIPGPSGQCTWPATTEAAHGFVSKLQPNNLRFIKISPWTWQFWVNCWPPSICRWLHATVALFHPEKGPNLFPVHQGRLFNADLEVFIKSSPDIAEFSYPILKYLTLPIWGYWDCTHPGPPVFVHFAWARGFYNITGAHGCSSSHHPKFQQLNNYFPATKS